MKPSRVCRRCKDALYIEGGYAANHGGGGIVRVPCPNAACRRKRVPLEASVARLDIEMAQLYIITVSRMIDKLLAVPEHIDKDQRMTLLSKAKGLVGFLLDVTDHPVVPPGEGGKRGRK